MSVESLKALDKWADASLSELQSDEAPEASQRRSGHATDLPYLLFHSLRQFIQSLDSVRDGMIDE